MSYLRFKKRCKLKCDYTTGQAFSALPAQIRGCGSGQQESAGPSVLIDKYPDSRKYLGHALRFINDHKVFTVSLQGKYRILKCKQISRILQIKKMYIFTSDKLARKGGLPALPRTCDSGDRRDVQTFLNCRM